MSVHALRKVIATLPDPVQGKPTTDGRKMAEVLNAVGDFVDKEELEIVRRLSADVRAGTRALDASATIQLDAFEEVHRSPDKRAIHVFEYGAKLGGSALSVSLVLMSLPGAGEVAVGAITGTAAAAGAIWGLVDD
jgi:hypothetical protein